MRRSHRWIALSGVGLLFFAAFLAVHRVDDSLSASDREYLPRYLAGVTVPRDGGRRYSQEIDFISRVQSGVLRIAPRDEGLPYDTSRGLRDLAEAGKGLCYDRSRAIEQILRFAQFDVRHVAIYSTAGVGSAVKALLTPSVASHAVSEVLTSRGWLVIDSNAPWISLDAAGSPVAMTAIQRAAAGRQRVTWKTPLPNTIYEQTFTFVYGLYSRHGHFYPPYDFVPDINYGEFVENVW